MVESREQMRGIWETESCVTGCRDERIGNLRTILKFWLGGVLHGIAMSAKE